MRQVFPTALCSLAQNTGPQVPICFICLEYTKDMNDKVGTCPGEAINDPNKAFV